MGRAEGGRGSDLGDGNGKRRGKERVGLDVLEVRPVDCAACTSVSRWWGI